MVLLFVACFSTLTYADSLIDYQFQIREFRWGNSRYDFNVTRTYGRGFISIDDDGSGYVSVEWDGKSKGFALSAKDLIEVEDDTIRLTYRYGSGELTIEINQYGAIVHYSYGEKYQIWKEK